MAYNQFIGRVGTLNGRTVVIESLSDNNKVWVKDSDNAEKETEIRKIEIWNWTDTFIFYIKYPQPERLSTTVLDTYYNENKFKSPITFS